MGRGARLFPFAVLAGVLVVAVSLLRPRVADWGDRPVIPDKDNLKTIVVLLIDGARSRGAAGYPPHSGRNFLLSLVARRKLDARNVQNLRVLFPPSMEERLRTLDPHEYDEVTPETLKTRRFPHLTGYAGRRNADPDARITDAQLQEVTPLVASASDYEDGLYIGFSNGAVRFMDWDELDMEPPQGRVVFGPQAQHPWLRLLSEE